MRGSTLWWIHNIISLLGDDESKEVASKGTEVGLGMGSSHCFIPGSFCWTLCFLHNMSRFPCFVLSTPRCSRCYETSEAKMTNIIVNSKELTNGLFSTVVLHEKQRQCFWFAGEERASPSSQDDVAASSTLHADVSIAQKGKGGSESVSFLWAPGSFTFMYLHIAVIQKWCVDYEFLC